MGHRGRMRRMGRGRKTRTGTDEHGRIWCMGPMLMDGMDRMDGVMRGVKRRTAVRLYDAIDEGRLRKSRTCLTGRRWDIGDV
jgi:hypothetical protein